MRWLKLAGTRGRIDDGELVALRFRKVEMSNRHAERLENSFAQEFIKWLARHLFDESTQNVDAVAINPSLARLPLRGQRRRAFYRFADRLRATRNARDKCIDSLKSYTQSKSAWIRLS